MDQDALDKGRHQATLIMCSGLLVGAAGEPMPKGCRGGGRGQGAKEAVEGGDSKWKERRIEWGRVYI